MVHFVQSTFQTSSGNHFPVRTFSLVTFGLTNKGLSSFFYKALYEHTDLNDHDFVSFVNNLIISFVSLKTQTLRLKFLYVNQGSYFNRIVKLWNSVCTILPPNSFSFLSCFKRHLKETYRDLCVTRFAVDMPCTWSLVRDYPCIVHSPCNSSHCIFYLYSLSTCMSS